MMTSPDHDYQMSHKAKPLKMVQTDDETLFGLVPVEKSPIEQPKPFGPVLPLVRPESAPTARRSDAWTELGYNGGPSAADSEED